MFIPGWIILIAFLLTGIAPFFLGFMIGFGSGIKNAQEKFFSVFSNAATKKDSEK